MNICIFALRHWDTECNYDDVIKWKQFPRYWLFVRGIHRSPVNSQHKGQWRGALIFSLICAWINGWVNNREAGDLRRHRAHYDVIVMTNPWSAPRTLRSLVSHFENVVWSSKTNSKSEKLQSMPNSVVVIVSADGSPPLDAKAFAGTMNKFCSRTRPAVKSSISHL